MLAQMVTKETVLICLPDELEEWKFDGKRQSPKGMRTNDRVRFVLFGFYRDG